VTIELSRRLVLVSGGSGLVLAIAGCGPRGGASAELGAWLSIAPDGITTLRLIATDIGQGAQTGLAQIVADELDADWSKLRVEMAPVREPYMVKQGGQYYTGGSSSIRPLFELFRKAGASARAMLIAAAAKQWSVDPATCGARNGLVSHAASGRSHSYGALASAAGALPIPAKIALKDPARRDFIGKPIARLDIPDKVNGRAIYGIDVAVPGMRIATLAQCPFFGGKLVGVDEKPALAVKGVSHVVKLEKAIIVVARNFHAAKKGLDALSPQWSKPAEAVVSEDAMYAALRAQIGAADSDVATLDPKTTNATRARVDAALAGARKTVAAEYQLQLLAHAPMEPMNATARVSAHSCEVWAPMQDQGQMRDDLATALNLPKAAIVLHTTKVGGGFGRRLETDYGVLAARAAKAVDLPVKLIWTREEDFTHDFYRPASVARIRASLDDSGLIRALDYTGATSNDTAIGGFGRNYPLTDIVIRQKRTKFAFPIGAWRSVDSSITGFLLESFVDEVAHELGEDPLAYRRRLLAGDARLTRVLDTAAGMAGWGHAPAGHFQGIAFMNSPGQGTSVAHVIELSVDGASKITLHRVCCAIDPGTAINPDLVTAQAESGIIMGLSAALGEIITVKDGAVEQKNFDAYPILRLAAVPRVDVRVLQTRGLPPGGVGEPPVPPVAPALANAVFAATGKRIRTLPLAKAGFTV
jgi:isoquinoline 1-oxidoreductase beta subunit